MIVLKELATAQDIKIIPRKYAATKVVIIGQEGETEYLVTPTIESYYLVLNAIYQLKEGQQYSLVVYNDEDIVYKDMINCTNQDVDEYTINKDEYKQNSSNNDYIILQ